METEVMPNSRMGTIRLQDNAAPLSAMTAGQSNVKPKSHHSDAGYAPISSSTVYLAKGKVPSLMMTPGMMRTEGTDERLAMKPY